jgi:hypothetical protein
LEAGIYKEEKCQVDHSKRVESWAVSMTEEKPDSQQKASIRLRMGGEGEYKYDMVDTL